jgi:outer membrane lipase/esterase
LAALLLCASASVIAANPAGATTLVLGDSLSDTGNAFRLTGGAFPDPQFYRDGRLSNGLIWADRIAPRQGYYADLLMGAPASGTIDGWNFAVAGAESGNQELDPVTLAAPGLLTQVRDYRQFVAANRIPGSARATSAFIWAGANDYGMRASDPNRSVAADGAFVDAVIANHRKAATDLVSSGVQEVVLLNQFDFSRAPTVQLFPTPVRTAGDAMTTAHNVKLLDLASSLNGKAGASVVLVDIDRLFDDVYANPSRYGFVSPSRPCLPDNGPPECATDAEANKRVFWDGTHLTSAAHALVHQTIGATRHAAYHAPRQAAVAAEISQSLVGAHRRALATHVATASRSGNGISVSLTADDTHEARGAAAGRSAYGLDSRTFGASVDAALSENVRAGILLTRGEGDAGLSTGSFEAKAITASGFLIGSLGALKGEVQVGHSWLDLAGRRSTAFAVDPLARSSSEGAAIFADASVSYALETGPLVLQPVANLRWTRVALDGWQESEGGQMNVRVDSQRRQSLVGAVGAQAKLVIPAGVVSLMPFAAAHYERELLDGGWTTSAVLGSGQRFDVRSTIGDRDWGTVQAGVRAGFGERLEASVAYETRVSWSGDEARAFSAGVKYRF